MSPFLPFLRLAVPAVMVLLTILLPAPCQALLLDPTFGAVLGDGGAGLGVALRTERSPYKGVEARYDLLPLYLYDGEHGYLHSYRAGLKLKSTGAWHADAFLAERFEGFTEGDRPAALRGLGPREPGVDFGVGVQLVQPGGAVLVELRRDVSNASDGLEGRVGYFGRLDGERWVFMPYLVVAVRDAALNDYYYGVRASEVQPGRPQASLGYGIDVMLGLQGRYDLSAHWRMLLGVGVTRMAETIRDSPIVGNDSLLSAYLGVAYEFQPNSRRLQERPPLLVKALFGGSTDCNLLPVLTLQCFSLDTPDRTRITGLELGRPFAEALNGWPLDIAAYVGVLHRDERGFQPDGWQIQAYMKAFYHGFPWRDRLRTRLGFGAGFAWASRVPYVEARDQEARGRTTSKLLNYLDPSLDVHLGDLFNTRSLGDTYFGIGVSHRSGIFGSSRLLGNVDGGSNYIYTYVESVF